MDVEGLVVFSDVISRVRAAFTRYVSMVIVQNDHFLHKLYEVF